MDNNAPEFYPFILESVAKEKVWGGRNLERILGKTLPPRQLIGETWEAWDGCRILNGTQRGQTLGAVLKQFPNEILGDGARGMARFPLLLKFLDAQDDLSIQVHPNDAQARQMENYPYGKTEAWYILHAAPEGRIIHGFNADVDRARVLAKLSENKFEDLLTSVPLQAGDIVFVPAGTVHAICKGVVLAEIQENSDITYRFYDWGRDAQGTGRELHIEQSLAVANLKRQSEHKIDPLVVQRAEYDREFLVACRYFSFERLNIRARPDKFKLTHSFHILALIEGDAEILYGDGSVRIEQGQTVVIPARVDSYEIAPVENSCGLLRAYVPDLRAEVIEPLRAAGFADERIARLGGPLETANDLMPLL